MYGYAEIQQKKKYYLENREIILQKRKKYVSENMELVKQCDKISKSKRMKPKKIKSPIIKTRMELILHRHLLKCKKLGQVDNFLTLDEWNSILLYFGTCAFCYEDNELYIGYVIPPSRKLGKMFSYGNVICICKSCRSSKKNLLLKEWMNYTIFQKYNPDKVRLLEEYINSEND